VVERLFWMDLRIERRGLPSRSLDATIRGGALHDQEMSLARILGHRECGVALRSVARNRDSPGTACDDSDSACSAESFNGWPAGAMPAS